MDLLDKLLAPYRQVLADRARELTVRQLELDGQEVAVKARLKDLARRRADLEAILASPACDG
jgi:hypothetical protein